MGGKGAMLVRDTYSYTAPLFEVGAPLGRVNIDRALRDGGIR